MHVMQPHSRTALKYAPRQRETFAQKLHFAELSHKLVASAVAVLTLKACTWHVHMQHDDKQDSAGDVHVWGPEQEGQEVGRELCCDQLPSRSVREVVQFVVSHCPPRQLHRSGAAAASAALCG